DPDQSVRVAAGNQYHELSIAATIAVAGTVGVGVGVGVHIVTLNTDAYINDRAWGNAAKDVYVTATATDSIIAVVAGAAGGEVGVAGTAGVTLLKTHTFACIGQWTGDGKGCNNASSGVTIVAGNNVLISASDRTKLLLITASLAGGYVGVGVAVGVAKVDKDTQAFIGQGSSVDALAQGATSVVGVHDGRITKSGFGTYDDALPPSEFRGLAVQASSFEDIFGLSASAGGGFVGVAGGVGVTLIAVGTAAFIAEATRINQRALANYRQSVNVTAVDSFKSLTVAGGVAGGFVGVAGGIDIGIANSSVTAYIGNGSFVNAANNVDVNALSRKDVSTYAVSVGGGFVGVAGSVSVWGIGTQATTTYHAAPAGPNKGTWTAGVIYAKGDVVTDSFDGKTYSAKGPGDTSAPSTSLAPHENLAEWEGPTDSLAPTPSTDDGRFKRTWTQGTAYGLGDFVVDPEHRIHYRATVASTNTTLKPHANLAEWTNAEWVQDTAYAEGDQVFDTDGNRYARQHVEAPATFDAHKHPSDTVNQWHGATKSGSRQRSEGQVASANDDSSGAPGYKNVLMGTSASTPSAWVSGHAYVAGARVSYSSH